MINSENSNSSFEIVSFYNFLKLNDDSINKITEQLEILKNSISLRGLIIIAPEGLNGTVSTPKGLISEFTNYLNNSISNSDWKFKYSISNFPPFKRFSIKIRDEIVTSGYPELKPDMNDSSHISPEEWHKVIEEEKDYFMIDVRNDYEVSLGSFKGAINPKTSDFKEFPDFIKSSSIPKDKPVYICCTGGIRCEKAYLEMKELGYDKVYQLDGGILTYMEKYPNGFYEGECFVFDDRVSLDKNLEPSKKYSLCPHCGDPASNLVVCKNCSKNKRICNKCMEIEKRNTCSKNCAYHYNLKINNIKRAPKLSSSALLSIFFVFSFALISQFLIFNKLEAEGIKSPEEVAKTAIRKMQEKGDPSPVVEYIDWEHMFNTLPKHNKNVMNVSTPEELKSFYSKVLESPSVEIAETLSSSIKNNNTSPDLNINQEKAKEVISKLKKRLEEKEIEMKNKLKNSEYNIRKIKEENNTALVEIQQTYNSEVKTDTIEMHKKEGNWFFTSLSNTFTQK